MKKNRRKAGVKLVAAVLTLLLGYGGIQLSSLMGGNVPQGQKTGTSKPVETTRKKTDQTAKGEMEVTFLDVGQGDCTIIRTEGHAMMVDAGTNKAGSKVAEYLQEENIQSLDYLILTHPDADHIGGGDNVLESVEVQKVLMLDLENDTKTYEEVIRDIEKYRVEKEYPSAGEVYELGDASFTILCPQAGETYDKGTRGVSVGIRLTHGEKSFVLCGDAEEAEEKKMVERFGNALECDVLKCGHHGSRTATCEAFLKATDPTWAVISCGEGNSYGHPHAEVLARLEDEDVQVYRTDRLGTITAVSDGKQISWKSEKKP